MGPILLCDKSAVQGLSGAELNMLRRNYSLMIPPVLLMEILADLRKAGDLERGQKEVQQLANKLVPACSYVNVGFRDIVIGEIRGHKVPGDGRPMLRAGKSVKSGPKAGMIFEQAPEEEALLRWQRGSFLDAEKLLAAEWRRISQAIDLEGMRRLLRERYSRRTKLKSFREVVTLVDELLHSSPPRRLISWFLEDCEIIPSKLEEPLKKIEANSGFSLETELPYTTRCIRVALVFHFGLAFGLVSTRPTNRIDLEYLYYVPFCMVFSSGDLLHRDLVEFVSKGQIFVPRDIFKSDLKGLAMWWRGLNADEQEAERQISGPPEFEASMTYQAWKKFMKPGYRNRAQLKNKMSPDIGEKVMEHIRKVMQGVVPEDRSNISIDDCDFVVHKRYVRPDGPCICGSDRMFKDCCGREIVAELKRQRV
jgi:SEC-C motif